MARNECDRSNSLDSRVLAQAADSAIHDFSGALPESTRARSSGGSDRRSSGGSVGRDVHMEVQQLDLEWRALSCSYRTNVGTKWVLDDVFGSAQPGEMQALLGPSGAGKSTLMDILAQRKSTGRLGGVLLVNGEPAREDFVAKTSYVPQFDNFIPVMTTLEVMQFYAGVVLPRGWSKPRRAARVEEVLQEMGLAHAQRTLVGGQSPGGLLLRGLSGGERKRLSIAAGIMAAPSVVFLDEPTTGLDAFSALTVMGYLKRMARDNGHVVIASIHQPRSAIWSMFDSVTLLSCGRLMYHGIRDGMVEWFHTLGFEYDATQHGVMSDWALDLVACGSHKPSRFYGPRTISTREEVKAASAAFVARWMDIRGLVVEDLCSSKVASGSAEAGTFVTIRGAVSGRGGAEAGAQNSTKAVVASAAARSRNEIERGLPLHKQQQPQKQQQQQQQPSQLQRTATAETSGADASAPSTWLQQFSWLYRRELITITRNPADVAGRTLTFTWVALSTGVCYYGLPTDGTGSRMRVNMLLNTIAFFCLMPYISMSLYMADKKVYLADVSAKLIRPSAYYLAKVVATTPFHLVSALVFTYTIYGMSGLRPQGAAILQNGILSTLMSLIAVQVMHCCTVIAPTQDMAFMYSIAWTAIQLLFNNFAITFKEVTLSWLGGLRYISAAYYAFEGLSVVEFSGVQVSCAQGIDADSITFLKQLLPNSKMLNFKPAMQGLQSPGADCVMELKPVLEYFDFFRGFGGTLAILLSYYIIVHIMTYVAMLVVARKEKR